MGGKERKSPMNAEKVIKEDIRNILVINLGGIGDILLSTPALKAIKNRYAKARIYLLAISRVREIVKDMPYIDEVVLFDIKPGIRRAWNNLKALAVLRKKRFDVAVNMRTLVSNHGAFKIRMLLAVIGSRVTAGRNTEGRGAFFDIAVSETDAGKKYEMEYDVELAEKLGAKVTDRKISYEVSNEDAEKAHKILEEAAIADEDVVIGVHPGGRPSRRWPIENFAETMRKIAKNVNCVFVITGDAQEASLADNLVIMAGVRTVNMAGRVTIKESSALIKRCSVFLSNDTAAMHIAALEKVPLVAICGPGDMRRFDPRNISDMAIVLYQKVECSPCNKLICKDMKCLKAISPDEVVRAAMSVLQNSIEKR